MLSLPRPGGRRTVADDTGPQAIRCGQVAIVGRPNVGKSTLLNRLVGQRISITSSKAQTTRYRIAGILTTRDAQFVFVDTPGFQTRHRSRLNERMNRTVTSSLAGVDATILVVEAGRITAADRAVIALLPQEASVVVALNKVDRLVDKETLLPQMAEVARIRPLAAIVPVSAETGLALDQLLEEVRLLLPQGAPTYDADTLTDRDERFLAAEFVREKIFRLSGEEVPYATTVAVDTFEHEGALRRIHVTVFVDRENQRAILLGAGGSRMKAIATQARADMERLYGGRVFLEVWVRVKSGWADDDRMLERSGY
jgi:GTP-binding protein Era